MESPNIPALRRQLAVLGLGGDAVDRLLHTFNTAAFALADIPVDMPAGATVEPAETPSW
jgi:hypothetical protein